MRNIIYLIIFLIIFILVELFILWLWMPLSDGTSTENMELSSKEKIFFTNLEKKTNLYKIIVTKSAKYKGRFTLDKYEYDIKIFQPFDLYTWRSLSRNILNEFCDSKLVVGNDKYNINFYVNVILPDKSKENTNIGYKGYFSTCNFTRNNPYL